MESNFENVGSLFFITSSVCSVLACRASLHQKKREIIQRNQTRPQPPHESIMYDVVIVGAGPAGATAAYYLGKQGLKVALVDKKSFPRPKVT
jgi:NADPH-dependent 2,4-dienoyl-CoA reductase/sulfur reductase-like enzyme